MSNNINFNLSALLEAVLKIENYSKDFSSVDEFYADEKSFDAAMMQFIVIGEVVSRLDEDFKDNHTQIPWQKIKNFRNIVAHDYFGIDADEIFEIINKQLIPLKNHILDLIENK